MCAIARWCTDTVISVMVRLLKARNWATTGPSKVIYSFFFAALLTCVVDVRNVSSEPLIPRASSQQPPLSEKLRQLQVDTDGRQGDGQTSSRKRRWNTRSLPTEPVPKFLMDLYLERTTGNASASLGISDNINEIRTIPYHGNPACNVFSFTVDRSLVDEGQVPEKAELQLHLSDIPPANMTWTLSSHHHYSERLKAIPTPAYANGTWIRLDATQIIVMWLNNTRLLTGQHSRKRIHVHARTSAGPQLVCGENSPLNVLTIGKEKPLLLVFSTTKTESHLLSDMLEHVARKFPRKGNTTRTERSVDQSQPSAKALVCSLKIFRVRKEDVPVGDKFLQAPQFLNINYCEGGCLHPLTAHLDASMHARLRALFNTYSPAIGQQGYMSPPCCVPTKLHEVTLVMFSINELGEPMWQLDTYQDVTAEKCGCR